MRPNVYLPFVNIMKRGIYGIKLSKLTLQDGEGHLGLCSVQLIELQAKFDDVCKQPLLQRDWIHN